jgi:hypothetical protein
MFFDEKNKNKIEKVEEPKSSKKVEKIEIQSFEDAWDNFSGTHFI